MRRPIFWGALIVASIIAATGLTVHEGNQVGGLNDHVIAYTLGKAAALVLFPVAIAGIAIGIGKLIRRTPSDLMSYYIVAAIWILLVMSSVTVTNFERKMEQYDQGFQSRQGR